MLNHQVIFIPIQSANDESMWLGPGLTDSFSINT